MSDTTKTSGAASDEVGTSRHDGARAQAEAALRTTDEAQLEQALHTDPEPLANVLAEDGPALPQDTGIAGDDDVAAISRTVQPGSDAPSRANITGAGSGADGM